MLPEMAVGYGIGMISSSVLGGLVYLRGHRRKNSRSMSLIQKNLEKKNAMWSSIEARIVVKDEARLVSEAEKESRTYWIIIISGIVLSWLGTFFLIIVFLSPLTRKEKQILQSELAERELSVAEVEKALVSLS